MSTIENKILQVGQILLRQSSYNVWSEVKVVKITATQAVLNDGDRLKLDHKDGHSRIRAKGYSQSSYYFDTREMRLKAEHSFNVQYAKRNSLAVFGDEYQKSTPSPESMAKIVAIHKAAMLEINAIIKSESEAQNG